MFAYKEEMPNRPTKNYKNLREPLRAKYAYSPRTGVFTHRRTAPPYHKAGGIAGAVYGGQIMLRYENRQLPAIRVAWLFQTGEWPSFQVAPRNGNRQDLRWANLAPARDISAAKNLRPCETCGAQMQLSRRTDPKRFCSAECVRRPPPMPKEERRRREAERQLRGKFGLSVEQYDALLDAQGGVCAICGDGERQPVVDHCHGSLKVRGVLCRQCNAGLGFFSESPGALRAAAAYIEKHRF